jgi:hypothetical protein
MPAYRTHLVFLTSLCVAILPLASCFVQKRVVPPPAGTPPNRTVITATKQQLIDRISQVYGSIQSFNMRADMAPSVGTVNGAGELTDYATIRAYVLFQRPDNIRVIGLDPVVHSTTIFDMASMGENFRVNIPSKSNFYAGNNNVAPTSKNKLENLRPTAFLQALVVAPPDPADQTLVEDDTDNSKAVYILFMIRQEEGELRLMRAVYFDRYTLQIIRQKTFDATGNILGETRYSDWKGYDSVFFPSIIVVRRPQDGYEVTMTVVDMKVNPTDMTAEKFALEQPPGSHLIQLK